MMRKIDVYQCEINKTSKLDYIGKVKYIGESFGVDALTDGSIYDVVFDINGDIKIVDDSGEDYIYDLNNPKPLDGSSVGGEFYIIDDPNNILINYIK